MSKPGMNKAIVQCDDDLYREVVETLRDALCGEYIYEGDSLTDLVARHCPELYEMCGESGYRFIPSSDPSDLMETPPSLWFDIIRITQPN